MSRNLAQWLAYQEQLNPHRIQLGLSRVRRVWQRMGCAPPARHVIIVGGTNGKGSTVALLESMFGAARWRTGAYTSPHVLRYNERIRMDGVSVSDVALVASFERIEAARGESVLSYFEFGTLAALDLFAHANLDVALLEVGMGGRLDAVNIVDADVAVITTIDLDHMDYLGPDRDSIGREKAGIARVGKPVIVGETDPPAGLMDALRVCGAKIERAGVDFTIQPLASGCRWCHRDGRVLDLPFPALPGPVQCANAATAIAALHALCDHSRMLFTADKLDHVVAEGLRHVQIPARLQCLGGEPVLFVDVGHNPQAARALAAWLATRSVGPVHAIYGALLDKDVAGVMHALASSVTHWHLVGLDDDSSRGLSATALAGCMETVLPDALFQTYDNVAAALVAARHTARHNGLILAFGSFFVASAVLRSEGVMPG